MKLKRILTAAAACSVAAAGLSVQAGAAGRFELLTKPLSEVYAELGVENGNGFSHNGDLYFAYEDSISAFFSITDENVKAWRSDGEFSCNKVTVDGELDWSVLGGYNNIPVLYNLNDDKEVSKRYSYDFNGIDKMTITYSSDNWFYANDLGYRSEIKSSDDEIFTVSFTAPDGTQNALDFSVAKSSNGKYFASYYALSSEDILGYVIYAKELTATQSYEDFGDVDKFLVSIDAIGIDGTVKNVQEVSAVGWRSFTAGDDVALMYTDHPSKGYRVSVFSAENDTVEDGITYYIAPQFKNSDGTTRPAVEGESYLYSLSSMDKVSDGVYLAEYVYSASAEEVKDFSETAYVLTYGDGKTSEAYKYMGTMDNNILLVKTADDKWGYINAEGELLATYDDAGGFIGKYAPVVKDGKAFLINRDFKRVSEKIDAESVSTLDKGLYTVTIDGEEYFMTYGDIIEQSSAPEDKPEEQEQPAVSDQTETPVNSTEPADTESTAEAPAQDVPESDSGDKTNPDTGVGSVGFVLAITAAGAGVAVLSRKRR